MSFDPRLIDSLLDLNHLFDRLPCWIIILINDLVCYSIIAKRNEFFFSDRSLVHNHICQLEADYARCIVGLSLFWNRQGLHSTLCYSVSAGDGICGDV